MSETATKTPGADARRADWLLHSLSGDRISGDMTPVVLASTLEAIGFGLLAINETLRELGSLVSLVVEDGRALKIKGEVYGDTSGRI